MLQQWLGKRREARQARAASLAASQRQDAFQRAHQEWQAEYDGYQYALNVARSYTGLQSSIEIDLHDGESLFYTVRGARLIEDRRTPGYYTSVSNSFSLPGTHVRLGASRGQYVPGNEEPTAIDVGPVFVTDRRIVFKGSRQTRECLFSKMISLDFDDDRLGMSISVSNRQHPTNITYSPQQANDVYIAVHVAKARAEGELDQLCNGIEAQMMQLKGSEPKP